MFSNILIKEIDIEIVIITLLMLWKAFQRAENKTKTTTTKII